jgi:hypothetical protein
MTINLDSLKTEPSLSGSQVAGAWLYLYNHMAHNNRDFLESPS